jgi:hypothetical protein
VWQSDKELFGTSYQPQPTQAAILRRAYELVQSVPYQVSARWLFYMLLQEGTYTGKDGYKSQFLPLLSKARKAFFEEWRPDTLSDDTRRPIERGWGFTSKESWLRSLGHWSELNLDKWLECQDYYVELWFEAKAMAGQFEHYTQNIVLRPFGGDPSIPYKWSIAKDLESRYERYQKPIVVLYFGDLDPKGLVIPKSAAEDIQNWCNVEFEFIRAGLNPGDETRYSILENPDKPGAYQWEALDDRTAERIITSAIAEYVDVSQWEELREREQEGTEEFRRKYKKFLAQYDQF